MGRTIGVIAAILLVVAASPSVVLADARPVVGDPWVTTTTTTTTTTTRPRGPQAPAGTGSGRRIVYCNHCQRVWHVDADNVVVRTYLVSGRRGVPRPGTYSVFSKSRVSTSGSVRLDYMVRFARGQRLAIGFHGIPVGRRGPIQSERQLGTPLSHGCVRQAISDARATWDFAPVGTKVIVVA